MDDTPTNEILQGDSKEVLADLPSNSVHTAMTSPPYYNLRDYEVDGQIGREDSVEEYISTLVDVGTELRRVLRDDGSLWLNLGDTYLSNKCKGMIPHRVAQAFVEDGWILRNDIVWQKPNPMPDGAQDRLMTTFEFVFHFVQQKQYYYDLDSVREPHAESSLKRIEHDYTGSRREEHGTNTWENPCHENGKNPGDVFEVTVQPFPESHFAVFPPKLCETPLKTTCPLRVCRECGTPYEPETSEGDPLGGYLQEFSSPATEVDGWAKSCECDTEETVPGIALDPFAGSGTLPLKAKEMGRRFLGIELNPDYVALAQSRIGIDVDEPSRLTEEGQTSLIEHS